MSDPSRPATEAELRAVMHAVSVIAFDLHTLLIDAGVQTRDEAIQRLRSHVAESAGANAAPLALAMLNGLLHALSIPDTSQAALARMDPAGEGD